MFETIQWTAGGVVMIDQTRLPLEEEYVTCKTFEEVATAIRDMIIRGAPAIGVAAAMGVALGVLHADESHLDSHMATVCDTLARIVQEAILIREEDIAINRAIGHNGAPLVPDHKTVLTHCNAGALATAGYGDRKSTRLNSSHRT